MSILAVQDAIAILAAVRQAKLHAQGSTTTGTTVSGDEITLMNLNSIENSTDSPCGLISSLTEEDEIHFLPPSELTENLSNSYTDSLLPTSSQPSSSSCLTAVKEDWNGLVANVDRMKEELRSVRRNLGKRDGKIIVLSAQLEQKTTQLQHMETEKNGFASALEKAEERNSSLMAHLNRTQNELKIVDGRCGLLKFQLEKSEKRADMATQALDGFMNTWAAHWHRSRRVMSEILQRTKAGEQKEHVGEVLVDKSTSMDDTDLPVLSSMLVHSLTPTKQDSVVDVPLSTEGIPMFPVEVKPSVDISALEDLVSEDDANLSMHSLGDGDDFVTSATTTPVILHNIPMQNPPRSTTPQSFHFNFNSDHSVSSVRSVSSNRSVPSVRSIHSTGLQSVGSAVTVSRSNFPRAFLDKALSPAAPTKSVHSIPAMPRFTLSSETFPTRSMSQPPATPLTHTSIASGIVAPFPTPSVPSTRYGETSTANLSFGAGSVDGFGYMSNSGVGPGQMMHFDDQNHILEDSVLTDQTSADLSHHTLNTTMDYASQHQFSSFINHVPAKEFPRFTRSMPSGRFPVSNSVGHIPTSVPPAAGSHRIFDTSFGSLGQSAASVSSRSVVQRHNHSGVSASASASLGSHRTPSTADMSPEEFQQYLASARQVFKGMRGEMQKFRGKLDHIKHECEGAKQSQYRTLVR